MNLMKARWARKRQWEIIELEVGEEAMMRLKHHRATFPNAFTSSWVGGGLVAEAVAGVAEDLAIQWSSFEAPGAVGLAWIKG